LGTVKEDLAAGPKRQPMPFTKDSATAGVCQNPVHCGQILKVKQSDQLTVERLVDNKGSHAVNL
jgi:hypothetical protein